ncbi:MULTISPECIES: MarR family winged helix-turn-helix transcriptional regulator [Dehalococcoides]|jgi:DNA-binding MarR family transcriptional regulator|uniref:MarR family winged helix-turn-helix transcriptional regulator n=1 Tax=Dehalococcoides TaxID=61434 RepID=UPI0003C84460|nr:MULTISPECIES: MarR family transcriptional regulator [Dehalococcoides]AHB14203.1 MarR family transcriptional regulator [Dehalococcoides mccartyi GY50]AII58554.1 MarR family transcriptional regulator [Dehalococcoides mccartyi CG1]APH11675.1 MarR family transcriptional regulator [Dehalococcoides mccartyi]QYY58720.1 MarR family transcriptional regulator [Dehalococcoides mccartyi]
MNKYETITLEHLLWINIVQARHVMNRLWERKMKDTHLTTEKFAIIHELLCLGGESTPHNLAKRIVFEPHSISAMLSRMEKDGLITKTKDLKKKHMVRIKLTQKAIELFPEALNTSLEIFTDLMKGVPREEKIRLTESLTHIRNKALTISPKKDKKLTPFKYT